MIVARTKNGFIPALALSLLATLAAPALADAPPAVAADGALAAPAQLLLVTLDADGLAQTGPTSAATVADLLAEHGIVPGPADYLSQPPETRLVDGSTVVYRPAVPVTVRVGATSRTLRTTAATVGALLAESGITLRPGDRVAPAAGTALGRGDVIRVTRSWTARVAETIPAPTTVRYTSHLPRGTTKLVRPGTAGMRIATIRTVDPPGVAPERVRIASRVAWPARAQVILRGTAPVAPIAVAGRLAAGGLAGAERLAGAAIHVLATAYTASCYGCSGTTASGAHAGHGIIAVDPSVIPLGTHLYIPGYGRAVAGDTGGAIVGHRVDLGFDRPIEALSFGARPMTIYVVK